LNKDPLLSIKGVKQSTKCGIFLENKLPKIDLVFSSALIRAIETACCIFPKNTINVSPFICEENCSLENNPSNVKRQKQRLKHILTSFQLDKIILNNKLKGNTSDFKKFIKYISNTYDLNNKNVAVITHSIFLKNLLNIKTSINNNATYKVVVDLETYEIDEWTEMFSGYMISNDVTLKMSFR
jgi:phosphohistidine phosphatase SixA